MSMFLTVSLLLNYKRTSQGPFSVLPFPHFSRHTPHYYLPNNGTKSKRDYTYINSFNCHNELMRLVLFLYPFYE